MSKHRSVTLHGATIAHGNGKVGDVPNVSLMPIVSCPTGAPCTHDCYDCKAVRMYPTVREARRRNWESAQNQRDEYFQGIRAYLAKYGPKYFRWHVGGDIPDADYLRRMRATARYYPETRFLAFTKHHALDYRNLPENFNVVFSMWPHWGNTRKRMPRAWMQDGTETRIPENAIRCDGQCDNCGVCWFLRADQSVYFMKH
jgi:hypothetical protein